MFGKTKANYEAYLMENGITEKMLKTFNLNNDSIWGRNLPYGRTAFAVKCGRKWWRLDIVKHSGGVRLERWNGNSPSKYERGADLASVLVRDEEPIISRRLVEELDKIEHTNDYLNSFGQSFKSKLF